MTREFKTIPAYVKTVNEDEGIVTHLISVYGNEDSGQDIAHKGMFTKTIRERKDQIRVVDNHNKSSVLDVVGKPLKMYEVGRGELPDDVLVRFPDATGGLMADTQFLMDTPEGKGTFIRLKAGAISEFSFAYDAINVDFEQQGGKKIRHLREVRLWEYGPVIFGMNSAAVAVSAKTEVEPITLEVQELEGELGEPEDLGNGISAKANKETGQVGSLQFDGEIWTETAARLWLSEHPTKELGSARLLRSITQAFGEKFSYEYQIDDIFDGYLVASTYGNPFYFKVAFAQDDGGIVSFKELEEWERGTLEFIPIVDESKRLAGLIEELEAEAGPEIPPTAESAEAKTQELLKELESLEEEDGS